MDEERLGPNGGMMYALEELEENIEWLERGLEKCAKEGEYVVFDCPGQVELVTHHGALRRILARVEKLGYRVSIFFFSFFLFCFFLSCSACSLVRLTDLARE